MQAVDAKCQGYLGCSAHDLADYPYRDDWEICQEDLAFVAPEDYERRIQVFRNHVGYTIDQMMCENVMTLELFFGRDGSQGRTWTPLH